MEAVCLWLFSGMFLFVTLDFWFSMNKPAVPGLQIGRGDILDISYSTVWLTGWLAGCLAWLNVGTYVEISKTRRLCQSVTMGFFFSLSFTPVG